MWNPLRQWLDCAHKQTPRSSKRHSKRLSVRPNIETFEDRTLLSAVPTVALSAPAQALIGETAPVSLTFSNTGDEPGYAPWAYVVLPTTGANGNNGVSFVSGSASYLGASVTTVVSTFNSGGTVTGPSFARDPATDQPLVLTGTPGNEAVFFQLPLGGFAVGQPDATIQFTTSISNLADVGFALNLQAQGGFGLGNTPVDDPSTDPPLLGSTVSTSVTPALFTVSKTYLGTEGETATGANFKQQYQVSVDVANGQTIQNLDITDVLPDSLQFVSLDSVTVNGSPASATAISTPSTTTPGGTLTEQLASVTGTTASDDADMTFTFYVPRDLATPPNPADTPVLDLTTGASATATDQASAQGTWTPLNPLYPTTTVTSNVATNTLQEKSIATQKTVTVVGGGPVQPGSELQYVINFQVSDYFAFQNVVLSDVLADGIRFDSTVAPTFSFTQQGGTPSTGNMTNYSVGAISSVDGSQPIAFNLSSELISRNLSGNMIGGSIPLTGTGSASNLPANTNPSPFGPTEGTIVFQAVVQEDYSVEKSPDGNSNVKQGDILSNSATIAGSVLSYADVTTPTGSRPGDDTAASLQVARGTLTKSIYAINGVAPTSAIPQVTVGDLVTYRLTYLLPISTVENAQMTDYLPLPIFTATAIGGPFGSTVDASVPAVNTAKFGPGVAAPPAGFSVPSGTVDYSTIFGPTGQNLPDYLPTISTNGPTNSVTFVLPANLQDAPPQTSLVDILFTVQVGAEPFADGLFLTNQATASEGSTNAGTVQTGDDIAQIQLTEPAVLQIKEGVVATNSPGATFTPSTTGPVTFNAPGTVGPRFSGTIDSTNLVPTPIDSNLNGVQAGRLVTYAIVVENDGSGRIGAFDVDIKNSLPTGLIIPTSGAGLNLQVFDGSGASISFTSLTGGLFGSGIQLTDPGPTPAQPDGTNGGALDPYDPTNGNNIAIVTFDLQVADYDQPTEVMVSTATLTNYTNVPGGANFVPEGLTDTATVTALNEVATKSLTSTSETSTSGNNVAIGEIARYRLLVQVSQLTAPGFQLQDNLPAGLTFLNDGTAKAALVSNDGTSLSSSILSGPGLDQMGDQTTVGSIVPTFVLPSSSILGGPFGDGTDPTFDFGTLTNSDRSDTEHEFVVVEFNARVDNIAGNQAGTPLTDHFTVLVSGQGQATSNDVPVTVQTPTLSVTKSVTQSTAQVGDTVTYVVSFTNTGSATGFDTTLRDTLPAFLSMTGGGVTYTSSGGAAGIVNSSSGGNVAIDVATLPVGASVTATYSATVQPGVVPNQTLTNSARVETTTLPGTNGTPVSDPNNPTGSANTGTPGNADGERTGSGTGPNNLFGTASRTVTILSPVPSKLLESTSEASTTGTNVAVGEVVRYRLVAEVPRSTMPAFQLDDLLPGGTSYLAGNTRLAFVSATGSAISSSTLGTTPGVASTDVTTVTPTFDASGTFGTDANGHPLFSLGNLVNSGTGSSPEYVVLEFNALVDNVATVVAGVNLDNTYNVLVSGAQSGLTSNTVRTSVVEPKIANLTKAISVSSGDAGDPVTYTVTWSNSGAATAFDVHLSDPLPTFVTRTGSVNVSTTGNVTGVSTAGTVGNTVDVVLASMDPGATVTVTYTATINTSVTPAQVVQNTAKLTWTSLPGTNGTTNNPTGGQTPGNPGTTTGERDGSLTQPQDNYVTSASATFTVNVPTLTQVVHSTSLVGTTGTNVNVGEQVTYWVTATLPEATFSGGLNLSDALPPGLTYVSSQIVSIGSQISGSALGVGASGTLSASNVVFNLGSGVVNTPDNVVNAGDQIVFQVVAAVANVPGNTAGTTLTTSATLAYGSGTTPPATASVQVVEAKLTLNKSVVGNTTLVSPLVTYRVVVSNPSSPGGGDAFSVVIADPIPTGMSLVAGSVAVVSAPSYATTAVNPGSSVSVSVSELRGGDSATIQYQAQVLPPATPGATITNTATVNQSSLPNNGGRPAAPVSGSATVTIPGPPVIPPVGDVTIGGCSTWVLSTSGSISDTTTGPWTGTVNYGDGSATQAVAINNSTRTFTLLHTYLTRAVYQVTVTISDAFGISTTTSFVTYAGFHGGLVQPYSQLVTINDGSVQRSMVNSITVTFPTHENLTTGAISLTTQAGATVPFSTITRDVNGQTVEFLQFTGSNVIGNSLPDGRYVLTINGSKIHNSQGAAYNNGGTISNAFWRMFGDAYGTASINSAALTAFQAAMRSANGTPPYCWYFDYDQNCTVDAVDYSMFLMRYGHSI